MWTRDIVAFCFAIKHVVSVSQGFEIPPSTMRMLQCGHENIWFSVHTCSELKSNDFLPIGKWSLSQKRGVSFSVKVLEKLSVLQRKLADLH